MCGIGEILCNMNCDKKIETTDNRLSPEADLLVHLLTGGKFY